MVFQKKFCAVDAEEAAKTRPFSVGVVPRGWFVLFACIWILRHKILSGEEVRAQMRTSPTILNSPKEAETRLFEACTVTWGQIGLASVLGPRFYLTGEQLYVQFDNRQRSTTCPAYVHQKHFRVEEITIVQWTRSLLRHFMSTPGILKQWTKSSLAENHPPHAAAMVCDMWVYCLSHDLKFTSQSMKDVQMSTIVGMNHQLNVVRPTINKKCIRFWWDS